MNNNSKKSDGTQEERQKDEQQLAQEYLDGWKRERAAFENYRKDEAERLAGLQMSLARSFLGKLLPILDSFELALKAAPQEARDSDWFAGYTFIKKQLDDLLKEESIEVIETQGKEFNPYIHEAIEVQPGQGEGELMVIEELQKGYKIGDFVLRPARVRVGKKGGEQV